jgi:hypothetical protein
MFIVREKVDALKDSGRKGRYSTEGYLYGSETEREGK